MQVEVPSGMEAGKGGSHSSRHHSFCPCALSGGRRGPGVWQQQLRHPGISPQPGSTGNMALTQPLAIFILKWGHISEYWSPTSGRALTVQLWWNSSGEQYHWSIEIIYLHAQEKKSQQSLFTFLSLILPSQSLNFSTSVFIALLSYSEKFHITQAGNAK